MSRSQQRQPQVQPLRTPPPPQMTDGEMASIIGQNQPWKDYDQIMADVRYEQLRQRLWNGY